MRRERWKLEHGRVLIRDAGYVVIRQTIEDDEIVDQEVLVNKGPHPTWTATSNCSARRSCLRSG